MPASTDVLKSAYSAATRPDTWLPTCTVTVADAMPVAVTFGAMRPLSTLAVSYVGADFPEHDSAATAAATTQTLVITGYKHPPCAKVKVVAGLVAGEANGRKQANVLGLR